MTDANALSVAFLVLLALTLLAAGGAGLARSPYTPLQTLCYVAALILVRVLWRTRPPRRFPLGPGKGGVVVCNHRSSIDPFFIQVFAGRRVHWMVAREYCEHPAFRWLLKTCEVIPVNRGGVDTASMKAAIRLAAQGELVGMLPEGRINTSEQFMLPVRPGAVLVALKARVPILPCYIQGAPFHGAVWSPLFMPARAQLFFGQPVDLSAYYGREDEEGLVGQLMLRVAGDIARLAGRDDFRPRLAGRRWKPAPEELTR